MTPEERIKEQSEFKKQITSMTKEQLEVEYNKYLDESKKLDLEVTSKIFKLPKSTKQLKQSVVFEHIKYFLNKQKVKWNVAINLVEFYEFFNKNQTEMPFPILDSVLRLFGQLDFEGIDEWRKVSEINSYFNPIADEYKEITDRIYDIAEKFSMVDSQLKLFKTTQDNDELKKDDVTI